MEEQTKKISFGFTAVAKNPYLGGSKSAVPKKVELIDCLESSKIKIKNAVEVEEKPFIIPIRDSCKNLLERVKETKKAKEQLREKKVVDNRQDSELTLDELAARELLRDVQKAEETKSSTLVHVLPIDEDKFVAEGKEEPTLKDYESVPISDFGMAMLRGMGWQENVGIGKNPKLVCKADEPDLRPKGLGLGADKMAKAAKPPTPLDKQGEELKLIKGAYAKIIAGQSRGNYCEVQGLDDEASRVIVKTALKGEILSLNEFLVAPVTKEEYAKLSRVINNAKYDEYKEKGNIKTEQISDEEARTNNIKERKGDSPQEEDKRIKVETKEETSSSLHNSDYKYKSRHKDGGISNRRVRKSRSRSNDDDGCSSKRRTESSRRKKSNHARSSSEESGRHKSTYKSSKSWRESYSSSSREDYSDKRGNTSSDRRRKYQEPTVKSSKHRSDSSSSGTSSSESHYKRKKHKKCKKHHRSRELKHHEDRDKHSSRSKKYDDSGSSDDRSKKYTKYKR